MIPVKETQLDHDQFQYSMISKQTNSDAGLRCALLAMIVNSPVQLSTRALLLCYFVYRHLNNV